MKKCLIILLSIPNILYSQETFNNFTLTDSDLTWQYVYEFNGDAKKGLLDKSIIIDPIVSDSTVSGRFENIPLLIEGSGLRKGQLNFNMEDMLLGGIALVEFKGDRYRVTLRNIMITYASEGVFTEKGEMEPLKKYATDLRGRLMKRFSDKISIVFNHTFKESFILSETNENW